MRVQVVQAIIPQVINDTVKKELLLSKLFIISLLLLIFNDLLLKSIFHNYITGKLSDFAGLIVLPLLLEAITGKNKKTIIVISALFFIYWKSPLSSSLIEIWNQHISYTIGRVIDYTDLIALSVLPMLYFYKPKPIGLLEDKRIIGYYALLSFTFISFVATAGTVGSIYKFEFLQSKKELSTAIIEMMKSNPNLTVPDSLKKYEKIYDKRLKEPLVNYSNKLDPKMADSIIFYTYEPKNKILFWFQIVGLNDNWDKPISELGLISYVEQGSIYYNKDLDVESKRKVIKLFTQEVITKLNANLLSNKSLTK